MLVAAQIAIAVTLTVGSALTLMSVVRLFQVELGFDSRQVTIVIVRPSIAKYHGAERARFHERVLDRLRQTPGIESAAAFSHLPLDRRVPPRMTVTADPDAANARRAESRVRRLSPGALRMLGVPMIRGREFAAADSEGAAMVAIVNERLARSLWPDRDPIGQVLSVPGGRQAIECTIVGVAANVRGNLLRLPDPELYLSALQDSPLEMSLAVRSGLRQDAAVDAVRRAVRLVDPDQALGRVTSMTDLVAEAMAYKRFNAQVLTLFGLGAVLLTASGILAVVMFAVNSRAREFAIRIALGARGSHIIGLVVGEMSTAIAVGLAAGLVAVYNLSFLLTRRALLFEVREFDASIYTVATVGVVTIAMVATWLPARRAARQTPVLALLAE